MGDKQRADFLKTANQLFAQEIKVYDKEKRRVRGIAKRRLQDIRNIVGEDEKMDKIIKTKAKSKGKGVPIAKKAVDTSTGNTFKVRRI